MTFLKAVTQRLFGRTVIDSLDINQNAWYIDEEQVTVTAAQLNGTSILPATSQVVDVANDDVLFLDHSGSHAAAYDSIADLMNLVCGTVTSTGLAATGGVISATLGYTAALIDVANDDIAFIDHNDSHLPKTTSVSNLATTMAGTGIIGASGTVNAKVEANYAQGSIKFGAVGDCTSVTIGGVVFAYNVAPTITNGEWTYGADAKASATNIAASINADTRNGGSRSFWAQVDPTDGDTVRVFPVLAGVPATATITRQAGAEPATLEAFAGGVNAGLRKSAMIVHTVTALDVDTTVEFDVALPFAPSMWTVQVRSATGAINYFTDLATLGTLPNRVHFAQNGATHIAATDIVTIIAQE